MISVDQALKIHYIAIAKFGGADGLRNRGNLESALARPFQTFGGEDLYPNIIDKAAALVESLVINHSFVDGNKRTGMLAMVSFLTNKNYKITVSPNDLYTFIITI